MTYWFVILTHLQCWIVNRTSRRRFTCYLISCGAETGLQKQHESNIRKHQELNYTCLEWDCERRNFPFSWDPPRYLWWFRRWGKKQSADWLCYVTVSWVGAVAAGFPHCLIQRKEIVGFGVRDKVRSLGTTIQGTVIARDWRLNSAKGGFNCWSCRGLARRRHGFVTRTSFTYPIGSAREMRDPLLDSIELFSTW